MSWIGQAREGRRGVVGTTRGEYTVDILHLSRLRSLDINGKVMF